MIMLCLLLEKKENYVSLFTNSARDLSSCRLTDYD